MRDFGESVHRRFLQGAVDEQTVVVTNESCYMLGPVKRLFMKIRVLTKGDNANGLEYATIDQERSFNGPSHLWGHAGPLRNDSEDDDKHTDERHCTGFGKLDSIRPGERF